MQRYGYLALVLLASCSSPHPVFMSSQEQVVEVEGSRFTVRIKGELAEAIRTNFEFVPKISDTFPKAAKAMEIASGCTVVPNSMKGDPALMVAKLDCS